MYPKASKKTNNTLPLIFLFNFIFLSIMVSKRAICRNKVKRVTHIC